MRSSLVATAVCVSVVCVAPSVAANGRFPAANQVVFSPSDASLVVLRTTFGVMISRDRGASWGWLCEDALGLPPGSSEDPALGLSASNALVAGFSNGMAVSTDTGCSWSAAEPLRAQFVKDVTVRPDAPHSVLALTSTFGADAGIAGAAGYAQQIFESTDDGVGWSALGTPLDPTALVTSIEAAATDPARLYVSALRSDSGAGHTAVLFVSMDRGAHWTEHALPFDPASETAPYIAAVDPGNADRVYVRTAGMSRLLVTTDAGGSFRVALTMTGQMLGFALSPDGSTVYVGSKEQGLSVAPRTTLSFHAVSAVHVECLATHGAELWACADEPSGFVAGVSQDNGATFTPKLHLSGVKAPLACRSDAAAAKCSGALFEQLCASLGSCPAASGPSGGGTSAAPSARASAGCGCGARRVSGSPGGTAVLAILAAATAWRRRLRARSAR